jgi:hypothetical protein
MVWILNLVFLGFEVSQYKGNGGLGFSSGSGFRDFSVYWFGLF